MGRPRRNPLPFNGELLRLARERSGLSIYQAAGAANCAPTTIQRLERGHDMSAASFALYCEAIKFDGSKAVRANTPKLDEEPVVT